MKKRVYSKNHKKNLKSKNQINKQRIKIKKNENLIWKIIFSVS